MQLHFDCFKLYNTLLIQLKTNKSTLINFYKNNKDLKLQQRFAIAIKNA